MKYTYSGDPGVGPREAIRFLTGDHPGARPPAPPFLSDEEIDEVLAAHPDEFEAAAICAERLASKASEPYIRLAARLRKQQQPAS